MDATRLQRVWEILRALSVSADFEAAKASGEVIGFRRFAHDLDHALARAVPLSDSLPTRDEIRGLLTWLLAQCTWELAKFRPAIEKAIEEVEQ